MKKIFNNIAFLALVVTMATSCVGRVDDIFDESSAQRAEETITEFKSVLTSAENGWRMEYYGDRSYGGYNVFVKFTDSEVTVASEQLAETHKAGLDEDGKLITTTSGYKMEQSQGIVLSFDQYNETFHFFSDPRNPSYGSNGEGFYGDFEFRVLEACADSVVLRGRKHQNKIVMYPVPANQTWEECYQSILDTETFMASRSYSLWVDDVEQDVFVYTQYRSIIFQFRDETETLVAKSAPYIVTPEGFKFYSSVDVNGVTIDGIEKGETDEYFLAHNDHKVAIWAYIPSLYEDLRDGQWFIKYDDLGAYGQKTWDKFKEALKTAGVNKKEATLYYALVGTYSGKLGFHFWVGNDADALWGLNIINASDDGTVVEVKNNAKDGNTAGKDYFKKHNLADALDPFIGPKQKGRTFKLSTDNMRRPSYLILEDVDDPTNVIKLYAETVMYPFGLESDQK